MITFIYNLRSGLYLDMLTCKVNLHRLNWENANGIIHCYCGDAVLDPNFYNNSSGEAKDNKANP